MTLEQSAHDERSKQIINRLNRLLADSKRKNEEYIIALQEAVRDAAAGLELPPVPKPKLTMSGDGDELKALVCVSDLQLGKRTPTYNSKVCEQRMVRYADKVELITALNRGQHPIKEARVYLLGDIVEGELIFPHQPWQVDASLFQQLMIDGPRICSTFLRRMLGIFEKVHVCGVIGNHGRFGESRRTRYNPETNADRMLYFHLQEMFRGETRLSWDIPHQRNERAWYTVDYPFGRRSSGYLLFHGDQIRGGFAGFPYYGLAKKIWGWRSGAIREPFDYAIHGHWHQPNRTRINSIVAFGSGSTESSNLYAQEQLAASGEPEQLLLFATMKRIVSEYWIQLSGE